MIILVDGTTTTMRRLATKHKGSLGHLFTPGSCHPSIACETGLPWAIDNGAYSGFKPDLFLRLLQAAAGYSGCLWASCPDVVGDAKKTLDLWQHWAPLVGSFGFRPCYVLQDGQEDVSLPSAEAYFIGGTTKFKLSAIAFGLCQKIKGDGKWLHMGRVNSRKRMVAAHDMGCDSFDGSSASRYGNVYIEKYIRWVRQIKVQDRLF